MACGSLGVGCDQGKLHGSTRIHLPIPTQSCTTLETRMLMLSTAQGGLWKQRHTPPHNDSGRVSPSPTLTTVGNGKAHYAATDMDSSMHKENTEQSTDSHTSSLLLNGRQLFDTNATTAVAATHTILKVAHRQTT